MVSSRLRRFQMEVLACMGMLGSLLASSSMLAAKAALTEGSSPFFNRVSLAWLASLLMFLGTEGSPAKFKSSSLAFLSFASVSEDKDITRIIKVGGLKGRGDEVSEKELSKAVEALFSGARMLSIHCGECRGPLFEKDGKVFCPSCGEKEKKKPESDLKETLKKKLEELKSRLETEKDHDQMMKILKEIEALVEVLKKLEGS